jgi:hypothetical protein
VSDTKIHDSILSTGPKKNKRAAKKVKKSKTKIVTIEKPNVKVAEQTDKYLEEQKQLVDKLVEENRVKDEKIKNMLKNSLPKNNSVRWDLEGRKILTECWHIFYLYPLLCCLGWILSMDLLQLGLALFSAVGIFYHNKSRLSTIFYKIYEHEISVKGIFSALFEFFDSYGLFRIHKLNFQRFRKRHKKRWFDLDEKITDSTLKQQDPYCNARGGEVLDLSTSKEMDPTRINFKCHCKIDDFDVVLCEIDSDSHISIISQDYFENIITQKEVKFLDEPPPKFSGMGSQLESNYPPVSLKFQIGGITMSGRFAVTSELTSSPILLGSDVMFKYDLSVIPVPEGGWRVQVGSEPKGSVPCVVTRKIVSDDPVIMCKKLDNDLFNDYELEELMEPGFNITGKLIDKNKELDFIRKHPKIPDKNKKDLISCLELLPDLYSGSEFSKKSFPPEIYCHDIDFVGDAPKEMSCKAFPVSDIRLQQLKETIYEMCKNGILKEGDSEIVSPCFHVLKKPSEGKTASKGRLCFDYRRLNALIKPLNFPLNNLKNFFQEASQFKIFSVLDIKNAFLSIPLTERAKIRSAIKTPFGVFLPQRLPFGLKTAPSAFCQAINKIIGDLAFCQIYMDDLLIGASDADEMTKHLQIVFKRLAKYNLKVQISKAKFFEPELKILGVIFSRTGKRIDPDKIKAISDFPPITTLKECQRFLGMLAYINSFIPHFSTSLYPVFNLLKNQKVQKFAMTKEAETAISKIKEFLKQETQIYNPNFEKPFYLATDASQVGVGSFLYQLDYYDKNEQGEKECLKQLGYIPDSGSAHYLIPGVSPGRQTPVVVDFLADKKDLKKYDFLNTLNEDFTMKEKIKQLESKIIHVRPIAWFSKLFTEGQQRKYASMEKEFLALMISILNFRDYMEAAKITYILTDSQPILWAMAHRNECIKLSRYLLKLFELNINFVCVHIAGSKNSIADFLSRIYAVEEPQKFKTKDGVIIGPKQAQHITPSFNPLQVLTKDDIIRTFRNEDISACAKPENCHLNVNSQLYRGLGPFEYKPTCLTYVKKVKINKTMETFGFSATSLQNFLTHQGIFEEQRKDPELMKTINFLEEKGNKGNDTYFLDQGILKRRFKEGKMPVNTLVPKLLVHIVIALFHFQTHAGAKKLYGTIRLQYFWNNMARDIAEFTKGCILCSIMKGSNAGKNVVGVPRKILGPRHTWQIDICSGFPPVNGYHAFLNCVDMYTGYTLPIPVKKETSDVIANIIDTHIIKAFGPPCEVSSDNAANLSGPAVVKLLKFYNILHRKTTPYSPQSHGLVEIQNRYVTQLVRLFSEQYKSTWYDVVTLAALIVNSVPRVALQNHSPAFLMFGTEPFSNTEAPDNFFDIHSLTKKSLNNRNFAMILREIILKYREKKNKDLNRKYLDFPENTLVYVKDQSKREKRKSKPLYLKCPAKIIKQYRCTVYALNILGRVSKHSKDNIKKAGDRSIRLFGKLPDKLKLVLGSPLDENLWTLFQETNTVPEYLNHFELDLVDGIKTRGILPDDSHVLENNEKLPEGNGLDDDDDIENIDEDDDLNKLRLLHEKRITNYA